VFGVVDFHGLLIEVRFQGIVSIRQGMAGYNSYSSPVLSGGRLLMPRKQLVHYS